MSLESAPPSEVLNSDAGMQSDDSEGLSTLADEQEFQCESEHRRRRRLIRHAYRQRDMDGIRLLSNTIHLFVSLDNEGRGQNTSEHRVESEEDEDVLDGLQDRLERELMQVRRRRRHLQRVRDAHEQDMDYDSNKENIPPPRLASPRSD